MLAQKVVQCCIPSSPGAAAHSALAFTPTQQYWVVGCSHSIKTVSFVKCLAPTNRKRFIDNFVKLNGCIFGWSEEVFSHSHFFYFETNIKCVQMIMCDVTQPVSKTAKTPGLNFLLPAQKEQTLNYIKLLQLLHVLHNFSQSYRSCYLLLCSSQNYGVSAKINVFLLIFSLWLV